MDIHLKRIYSKADKQDGYRVLVDRLWPRGISKEEAKLDDWKKEIAPTADLRKWFNHKKERFDEFKKRYIKELEAHAGELDSLIKIASEKKLTLLYGAKDEEHNQAIVLKEVLEKRG